MNPLPAIVAVYVPGVGVAENGTSVAPATGLPPASVIVRLPMPSTIGVLELFQVLPKIRLHRTVVSLPPKKTKGCAIESGSSVAILGYVFLAQFV